MKLTRHPLSALFAMFDLAGEDLKMLADDIKANGQIQPITMHEDAVLDGWNRYQACLMAKVKPKTTPFKGGDPWAFVCSSNMHRRHMTAAERFGVMALYFKMQDEAGERSKLTVPTVAQIEKTLDVSHGTAVKGRQILEAADPNVAEALAKKEISLDRAAEVSKMPKETRQDAIKAPATAKAKDDRDARIAQLTRLLTEAQAENTELKAENEDLKEKYAEQGQLLKDAIQDNETLDKTIRAEDRLRSLMDQVGQFKELARVTESRNKGLMVGNHDLAKRLESALRKVKKLEGQPVEVEEESEYPVDLGEAV